MGKVDYAITKSNVNWIEGIIINEFWYQKARGLNGVQSRTADAKGSELK